MAATADRSARKTDARHHAKNKSGNRGGHISINDYVAEIVAATGLTYQQARSHSLAQLKSISKAVSRLQARDGLLSLQAAYAAMSGAWSKDGFRQNYEPLRKLLEEHGKQH